MLDLRDQFEIVGFDLTSIEDRRSARHTLLMPVRLRLAANEPDAPWGEWPPGDDLLVWDSIDLRDVEPSAKTQCLWAFIELADAPPESFVRFVEKWGLKDFGYDAGWMVVDKEWCSFLDDWRSEAHQALAILEAIVATEAGELVSEDLLLALKDGDPDDYALSADMDRYDVYEMIMERRKRQLEHWRSERRLGRGLAMQRTFIINLLLGWMNPLDVVPGWDDKGRRVEAVAIGAKSIVGAELGAVFGAPLLDVYMCSVCGRPFPLDLEERQRRPRAGVRRLCSQPCRDAAKRADNLKSWHRNKAKWAKPKSKGEEND